MLNKPMLAAKADMAKLKYPVIGSVKIDGIRCLIKDGVALSRSMKPIPNPFVQSWAKEHADMLNGMDGELMIGPMAAPDAFRTTTSGVMKKTGEPDFRLLVFDLWDMPEPFAARFAELTDVLDYQIPRVELVEHLRFDTEDEVMIFAAAMDAQGQEGIMLRDPAGKYKQGRATANSGELLKLKKFTTDEAVIVGVQELMRNDNPATTSPTGAQVRSSHKENMVPLGTLGALELERDGVRFAVGSGLDVALRAELWAIKDDLIGQMVTYKHFPIGAKDKPRFPTFVGIRHADDMDGKPVDVQQAIPEGDTRVHRHVDFETKSKCDLIKHGAYAYAAHPSTAILWMCWADGDGPIHRWNCHSGEPFPKHVLEDDVLICAHNAGFERLITNYVATRLHGVKHQPIEKFYCTAALCRSRGIPGALADAGIALQLRIQKGYAGNQLIKIFCIIPEDGEVPGAEHERWEEFGDYCHDDVATEREITKHLPPLSADELHQYHVNERVNDRGIPIDVEFAAAAAGLAEQEVGEINAELIRVTNGRISTAKQYQRIKNMITESEDTHESVINMMTVYKKGEKKYSLGKAQRTAILEEYAENPDILSPICIEVIELCSDAGRSSTSKFNTMVNRANDEGRVQGAYMFAGAAQTQRFSSRGVQMHNMMRKVYDGDIDEVMSNIIEGRPIESVMDTLVHLIRPSIWARKGYTLVWGDWSSIENRVLPWLAMADKKVQTFVEMDNNPDAPDNYEYAAADIYHIAPKAVTKEQRQIGKVTELSCIAEGQLVLTDHGLVPIEDISLGMRVWDGVDFVTHEGVIFQGIKEVMQHDGLIATGDHTVWTASGHTQTFDECARRSIPLMQTGTGRRAIRMGENYLADRGEARPPRHPLCAGDVRRMFYDEIDIIGQYLETEDEGVPSMQPTAEDSYVVEQATYGSEIALRDASQSSIRRVWRSGHSVQLHLSDTGWAVVAGEYIGEPGVGAGQDKQRRALRTGQHPVGATQPAEQEYPKVQTTRNVAISPAGRAVHAEHGTSEVVRGVHAGTDTPAGSRSRGGETEELAYDTWQARTYDIVNCGPRHRFTVSGKLVHNCGYQGSHRAFIAMGTNYGIYVPEAEAKDIVKKWRGNNPWLTDSASGFWAKCERAAYSAVSTPGTGFDAGRITYIFDGTCLYGILPNEKVICYQQSRIEMVDTPWGAKKSAVTCIKPSFKPAAGAKEWPRMALYGGLLAQGATQCTAAHVLKDAMDAVDDDTGIGSYMIGHTHDEMILEVPAAKRDELSAVLEDIMITRPWWAPDLPLKAEVSHGDRYSK